MAIEEVGFNAYYSLYSTNYCGLSNEAGQEHQLTKQAFQKALRKRNRHTRQELDIYALLAMMQHPWYKTPAILSKICSASNSETYLRDNILLKEDTDTPRRSISNAQHIE